MTDGTPTPVPPANDPAAGRRARLTVFLVVFIDLLGFGIVLPQLPLISEELLNPLVPGGKDTPLAKGASSIVSLGKDRVLAAPAGSGLVCSADADKTWAKRCPAAP